jgi:N4-gp56 family major capsid protein
VSLDAFIPELWADTLLVALRKNLVFANLCNTDYQGRINQMGDTVRISGIGSVTISDYVKDTDINAPQSLTDAQTMLSITQAKYYNFEVDDVDQAQQHPKVMTEAMSYAAYQLAETIDEYVAGFYTDAPSGNTIGTSGAPVVITAPTDANIAGGSTVYDELVALGQYLTQNNVPMSGRWAVIPPWCATYLALDIRFTSFNTAQANARLASGSVSDRGDYFLGQIAGMDVYQSNNAHHVTGTSGATGSVDVVMAGHPMALSYADGLKKTEAYRPPYRFADAVKGLCLYGTKTVRPQALAVGFFQHP